MRFQIFVTRKMIQNILLIQGNAQRSDTIRRVLLASVDQSLSDRMRYHARTGSAPAWGCRHCCHMVDLSLPDIAGVEFFDQLFAAMPNIPIIIVASVKDEKIAKLAVQRGARDYFPTHCIDKLFFRRQSPPSSLMRPRSKNFFTKKSARKSCSIRLAMRSSARISPARS